MSRIRHIGGAVTAVRVLDVFSELSRLESRVRNSNRGSVTVRTLLPGCERRLADSRSHGHG